MKVDNIAEKLYSLQLGQSCSIVNARHGEWWVTRVPGGWIWENDIARLPLFVPFDNEYQGRSLRDMQLRTVDIPETLGGI